MTRSRQPSQNDLAAVLAAFDPAALKTACTTDDFTLYATRTTLPGTDRFYWYQDNGSDILAVAHLDTVQSDRTCQVIDTAAGPLAVSGALDDRLGAYVILDLLPALGVTCDILLTTDEEIGQSTAREFAETCTKDYNWMVQFDRGGTDVVLYQYEADEYAALVSDSGARVGCGSYSDICDLDALGCIGVNWGVGYEDYHSPRAHAWLADTFRMVARFLRFYAVNAGTYLPYIPESEPSWDYDYDDTVEADCGHLVDLYDARSYVEWSDKTLVCVPCATGT